MTSFKNPLANKPATQEPAWGDLPLGTRVPVTVVRATPDTFRDGEPCFKVVLAHASGVQDSVRLGHKTERLLRSFLSVWNIEGRASFDLDAFAGRKVLVDVKARERGERTFHNVERFYPASAPKAPAPAPEVEPEDLPF